MRWEDADLGAEQPTVTICGTIVYLKGKGFFRQEWTKSDAGHRTVILPRFAVGMLLARKLTAADNPHDAIFTSRHGTWLSRRTCAVSGVKPAPTRPGMGNAPHVPQDRR